MDCGGDKAEVGEHPHPYIVEVYVARDGSEACLNPPKAFCARDGAVKEVRLELEFKREVYEDRI